MYTQEDLKTLSDRVRKQLQAIHRSDQVAYTMAFDKLDFDKIKFNDYSAEDCKIVTKSVFKFVSFKLNFLYKNMIFIYLFPPFAAS